MAQFSAKDFERLPGKARNYRNKKTGEIISRRKYDQQYGRLAESGLTYEKQAVKSKEENPLKFSLAPRKGKKAPPTAPLLKQVAKHRKQLKNSSAQVSFIEIDPVLEQFVSAIYAVSKTANVQAIYIMIKAADENGNEVTISATPYIKVPKTPNAIIELWDDLQGFETHYKMRLKSIVINLRLKP